MFLIPCLQTIYERLEVVLQPTASYVYRKLSIACLRLLLQNFELITTTKGLNISIHHSNNYIYRGVHRTLTPRSQTLFHRLGTIPVEWEWLALIDWIRILAPYILAHDSLVPSLIPSYAVWERDRGHKCELQTASPTFRYTMHWLRDVEKCLDPSLSWSAPNFDDWLTHKLTDRTDCLTPLRACARGIMTIVIT